MKMSLRVGVLVPVIYFGAQLLAMRYYPGYDVMRQAASELGSDKSTNAHVLNTGAMLMGCAILIASFGFFAAMKRIGVWTPLVWLTWIALLSAAIGAAWAGWFPLPDPRHNSGPIGIGAFVLPLLLPVAIGRRAGRGLQIYLLVNMLTFFVLVPVMRDPPAAYRGALQRVAAAVLYGPIGVAAFSLGRRLR